MQANNNDKVLKEFGSNVQLALDASIMQFMEDIATNIMDDIRHGGIYQPNFQS